MVVGRLIGFSVATISSCTVPSRNRPGTGPSTISGAKSAFDAMRASASTPSR
jgi:hypothetical protein